MLLWTKKSLSCSELEDSIVTLEMVPKAPWSFLGVSQTNGSRQELQLLCSFLGHADIFFTHAPCLGVEPPENSPVSSTGAAEFWVGRNPVVKGSRRGGTHGDRATFLGRGCSPSSPGRVFNENQILMGDTGDEKIMGSSLSFLLSR